MAIFQGNWNSASTYSRIGLQCFDMDKSGNKSTATTSNAHNSNDTNTENGQEQMSVLNRPAKSELHLISGILNLASGEYRKSIDDFIQVCMVFLFFGRFGISFSAPY